MQRARNSATQQPLPPAHACLACHALRPPHALRLPVCTQAFAAPAGPAAKHQNVPAPAVDPLAGLSPPEVNLPPGLETLNLTQLAPLLPLLSAINGSVVQTWIPVFERVDQRALAGMAPILNSLTAQSVEAIVAALPYVNLTTTLALLPAINAIPPKNLVALTKVLGTVDPRVVDALLPSIAILDPEWINKVVPAMAAVDPNYLVAVVTAIAPVITKVDPNSVVALLPALNGLSVDSWRLTIDLMSRITPAQVRQRMRACCAALLRLAHRVMRAASTQFAAACACCSMTDALPPLRCACCVWCCRSWSCWCTCWT